MRRTDPRKARPLAHGAAAAGLTLGVAWLLPAELRLLLLGSLLALTAGIYMGFGFLDGRGRSKVLEAAIGLLFVAAAVAGMHGRPVVLAVAWAAHVVWDLVHRPHAVATRIPTWVPTFCLAYDLILAAAILAWWPPG